MKKSASKYRTETDSMGDVVVPKNALYQAQTQRAHNNFQFSQRRFPAQTLNAIIDIKAHAAFINAELGLLDNTISKAILAASDLSKNLDFAEQFPLDLFQTGSGTSTNMNVNEVIATLASQSIKQNVHPNDHVNMGQSSNDVVPSAISLSAVRLLKAQLYPALTALISTLKDNENRFNLQVKTGRTHLMDAMPITLGQEFRCWRVQLEQAMLRISQQEILLYTLPLGGTAVGSGVNTHRDFAKKLCQHLSTQDGIPWKSAATPSVYMSAQEHTLALAGSLKTLAVALMKIANDVRWMNSGPLAGLNEIQLQALQPGSSIMPGKVNPVIPEAVAMIAAEIIGNECALTIAAQSGNFQLNVMLPLIADKLLASIELLSTGCSALTEKVFADFTVNQTELARTMSLNPVLATALNSIVGYNQAANIAKRAVKEQRSVLDVAAEVTSLSKEELGELLNPLHLALPHANYSDEKPDKEN
ncbi:class II fumarate hydratase [Colwelliaceae bacterium 6471]